MMALSFIILAISLIAAPCAWGESLMDIKAEELGRPVKSKWGKDPFLRFGDKIQTEGDSALPEFVIEGIMTDGNRALVIINGGFYRKGDTLSGFVIEDILADRVTFKKNGKSYTLQVKGFTVRGPAMEAGQ